MKNKYITLWWKLTLTSSQIAFTSRTGALLLILGKLLRFFIFFSFLLLLTQHTKTIAGYTLWEVVLFFMTFNLVDILAQLFLRAVYSFRTYVVTGDFDYFLIRPFSPLFRSLFGGSDILDLSILFPSLFFIYLAFSHIATLSSIHVMLYIVLVLNAFLISIALHICVLALGVMTTEIDSAIMLYRDLMQMGRVPVDVYTEPLRSIITFIIPVGIMMSFPSKVALGILSWQGVGMALLFGGGILCISLLLWRYALRVYTSASS